MIFSKKMCFCEFFGKFFYELLSALEKKAMHHALLFAFSVAKNYLVSICLIHFSGCV